MSHRFFALFSLAALAAAAVAACGGGGSDALPFAHQTGTGGSTWGSSTSSSSSTSSASSTSSTSTSSTSTSSGAGGGGGAGGCSSAAQCADAFNCTIDTCNAGACAHEAGPTTGPTACPPTQFCDVLKGCVPGVACADTSQCVTKFGGDACNANIQCDPATSVCTYQTLDKDQDGHPPVICGGDDCNDGDPTVHPGASESCNGKDDNCNGQVDEGAMCGGLEVCQGGACVCPPANTCGALCVDMSSNHDDCGSCGHACPFNAVCTNSVCVCPAGESECNGQCVDYKSDPKNCSACGSTCGAGFACSNSACTCAKSVCNGACIDPSFDPNNCGACNKACPPASVCQGGTCICGGGAKLCNGQCVDTTSDPNNCNGCGIQCAGACQGGVCQSLWYVAGVQQNVPPAMLNGWTECYQDTYTSNLTANISTVVQQCNKAKLLMACRKVGAPNYQLVAMAPRTDVLFDCGSTLGCVHQANGVGWYFSTTYSWGFAPGGQVVNRNSCDYNPGVETLPGQRMCWHTQANTTGGFRCGDNTSEVGFFWLNTNPNWERAVFHAN